MKKNLLFLAASLVALSMVSCSKENGQESGPNLEEPSSTVSGLYVVETGIKADPDGFNMITDGGFERENWKTNTLFWHPETIESSEEPCTGKNSIRFFYDGEGWNDLAIQTINVKKGQSYTLSLKYRGAWASLNCYMGFRAAEGHDVNTNTEGRNDAWDEGYSYTWDNVDDTQANVFFGGWWWYGLWVELDDMKVIPTGSNNDSFIPSDAKVAATSLPSAANPVVKSAEKAVVAADATVGMLHNAVIDGATVENVYLTAGLNKAGSFVVATATATDVKDFVPTAAIAVDGTTYVHGYSGFVPAQPEAEIECTASKAVILSSKDGAKWETAVTFAGDGKFAKAAFCKKDNYIYVFGQPIADGAVNTYVARVEASKLGDLSAYEYWDGGEYAKGTEEIAASIFYGPTDCMSVVYNKTNYAYMAVYRSRTTGQLVYRDAGLAEGEWSGEKLLVADPANVQLYAPQIVVNEASKLGIIASAK